jgi:phospholipid-binding lipoprotein MlaA
MTDSKIRLAAILFTASLSFSAQAQPQVVQDNVYDPLEPANRAVYEFNVYADRYMLKPVAQGYDYIMPKPVKTSVTNVLSNLNMPVVFVNSVLQGNPENAFSALWSFILNTTLGVLGIFDFAGENTDLRVHSEDFGQTLGYWGVGEGPYLVVPLMGPSNIRDTGAMVVDFYSDPYNQIKDDRYVIARLGVQALDSRYRLLDTIDKINNSSLDPYAAFRSAYQQRRDAQITNTHSNDKE